VGAGSVTKYSCFDGECKKDKYGTSHDVCLQTCENYYINDKGYCSQDSISGDMSKPDCIDLCVEECNLKAINDPLCEIMCGHYKTSVRNVGTNTFLSIQDGNAVVDKDDHDFYIEPGLNPDIFYSASKIHNAKGYCLLPETTDDDIPIFAPCYNENTNVNIEPSSSLHGINNCSISNTARTGLFTVNDDLVLHFNQDKSSNALWTFETYTPR
jgi:hypothetical protein